MKSLDDATHSFTLETLEDRIAPAALINGSTVQYTDNDGDLITIKLSKNLFTNLATANSILHFDMGNVGTTGAQELHSLDLAAIAAAKGVSISITAKPAGPNSNGTVNVGEITAAVDLGNVVVKGDLGRITAGDTNFATAGLKSVTANSMGVFGVNTGAANLLSVVNGDLGAIKVLGDMKNAGIRTETDPTSLKYGNISSVYVGGSLIGGASQFSGSIVAGATLINGLNESLVGANIGKAFIGADLLGGTAKDTGALLAAGKISTVTIQGDLKGGAYTFAGTLLGYTGLGKVNIGGSLTGSSTDADYTKNGSVVTLGNLTSIRIEGSINGGAGDDTGYLYAVNSIGSAFIGGNLQGADGSSSGSIYSKVIKNVTVLGDLIGDDGAGSGGISTDHLGTATVNSLTGGAGTSSGSIFSNAGGAVNSVKVIGNVTGGHGQYSGTISIQDYVKSISVGGNVEGSLLAGSSQNNGYIVVESAGTIFVAGNIVGGVGDYSGNVHGTDYNQIKTIKVGGSLIGNAEGSGSITSFNSQTISVGGSVVGGTGLKSGYLFSYNAGSVTVGGDVTGGDGEKSGRVEISNGAIDVKSVKIIGGVTGGLGLDSGSVFLQKNSNSIGSVSIGDGILGGSGQHSGYLEITVGKVSAVAITGNIEGGTNNYSGYASVQTFTGGSLGSFTLKGSVLSGNTFNKGAAGYVEISGQVATVNITGQIKGGTNYNNDSGLVKIYGNLTGKMTVGGDISGGVNSSNSGAILFGGKVNELLLKGSLIGGSSSNGSSYDNSGTVIFDNSVKKITVEGSVKGGTLTNGSTGVNYGSIRIGTTIDTLTIKGNIAGSEATGGQNVFITAGGNYVAGAKTNLAIKTLNVGASVKNATILGGYSPNGTGINGNGAVTDGGTTQIGKVTVNGNWINSSLATGSNTGMGGHWGDITNVLIPDTSSPALIASIQSINIKGSVIAGATQNAFVAERIAQLLVGGFNVILGDVDVNQVFGPSPLFKIRQLS